MKLISNKNNMKKKPVTYLITTEGKVIKNPKVKIIKPDKRGNIVLKR